MEMCPVTEHRIDATVTAVETLSRDAGWRNYHFVKLTTADGVEFVRTPAPALSELGNFYGGQWWLVPDDRTDVPADAAMIPSFDPKLSLFGKSILAIILYIK